MAQLLDFSVFSIVGLSSELGVGWKLNTYVSGTSTAMNTYPTEADAIALTNANPNPIVISSDGRLPAIWMTAPTKGVLTDENDVVKKTVDPLGGALASTTALLINLNFVGALSIATGWMGGVVVKDAATFAANFAGGAGFNAAGEVVTNPASDYVITVKKNGSTVGTITINSSGVFAFATTGGTSWSVVEDDAIDFYGPGTIGIAEDFKVILVGSMAA